MSNYNILDLATRLETNLKFAGKKNKKIRIIINGNKLSNKKGEGEKKSISKTKSAYPFFTPKNAVISRPKSRYK